MELRCFPIAFARWKAEIVDDGAVYGVGIGNRPGCAIRDAINEFCLVHGAMPEKTILMNIVEWE
jgi:hypothetical protein